MKLLITENKDFSPKAIHILKQTFEVRSADLSRTELIKNVADAHILWIRLRHFIDSEILGAARNLKIIASPTTGLNHIDMEYAEKRGIRIISLRGETDFLKQVYATAEHTIGLMLAMLRKNVFACNHVLSGGWNRDLFKGYELAGKTVGIVGYGRLGRIVAVYLQAFHCNILTADPEYASDETEPGVKLVPLEQLLAESDIVSLHVNLKPENEKFFSGNEFALMKPGSWFVNTSRGELIDETALLNALQAGHLAGAALDVLRDENANGMAHNKLIAYAQKNDNLMITPHIGGCTVESMEKTEIFLAEKLVQVLHKNR
jgi:D-3-phosphoglycerate dehydrogenase